MRPLTAQWVANAVSGELAAEVLAQITSVEKDSRDVTPGALYVAIIGERVDGHDFAQEAFVAGATLALVSQPVAGPHVLVDDVVEALGRLAAAYVALLRTEGDINVIGITGSNGKTTTKDLLGQILPSVVVPAGSFNNEIGLPLTVLSADLNTRHLVLEMGASAPGDLAYLTRIAPLNVAIVLTVGTAHLGGYGSAEGLAEEKATLLDGLVPGGVALLNADDPHVAAMAIRPSLAAGDIRVQTFGTSTNADLVAADIDLDHGRAVFTLNDQPVRLRLVGEHHVTNAMAATAAALQSGMELVDVVAKVSEAIAVSPHRMNLVERADGVWILDDSYNASPESMRAALRALKEVTTTGRSFAVIGAMGELGDATLREHDKIGVDVVRLRVDHLLVVGEGAKATHVSAVREGSWGEEAAYVATIDEARAFLDGRLTRGDTVLIKASHGSGLWKLADQMLGS